MPGNILDSEWPAPSIKVILVATSVALQFPSMSCHGWHPDDGISRAHHLYCESRSLLCVMGLRSDLIGWQTPQASPQRAGWLSLPQLRGNPLLLPSDDQHCIVTEEDPSQLCYEYGCIRSSTASLDGAPSCTSLSKR